MKVNPTCTGTGSETGAEAAPRAQANPSLGIKAVTVDALTEVVADSNKRNPTKLPIQFAQMRGRACVGSRWTRSFSWVIFDTILQEPKLRYRRLYTTERLTQISGDTD